MLNANNGITFLQNYEEYFEFLYINTRQKFEF